MEAERPTTLEHARASRLTPFNDSYPTCERACATLRISTFDVPPDTITSRLGVLPTRLAVRHSQRVSSMGRVAPPLPHHLWLLSSEGVVESLDLRRHLDWLLDRLDDGASQLRALQAHEGVRMCVTCIWWSAHGSGGPALWPEQMQRLAAMNLELNFEIGFYGDEDDDSVDATRSES